METLRYWRCKAHETLVKETYSSGTKGSQIKRERESTCIANTKVMEALKIESIERDHATTWPDVGHKTGAFNVCPIWSFLVTLLFNPFRTQTLWRYILEVYHLLSKFYQGSQLQARLESQKKFLNTVETLKPRRAFDVGLNAMLETTGIGGRILRLESGMSPSSSYYNCWALILSYHV